LFLQEQIKDIIIICVHDLAKRLEMYIIPDNLCKRRVEL